MIKKLSENFNFKCFGIDLNIPSKKTSSLIFLKSSYNNFGLIKKINPDIIIINNFIEHIEDLKIIKKLINKLKKKISIVILTPDANSSGRIKFSQYWSGYHSPRHKVIFNKKNIKKIIPKNKRLKLIQSKIYDPFTNFISIGNLLKQICKTYLLTDIFKILIFSLYIFIDIKQKNRLLLIIKKM